MIVSLNGVIQKPNSSYTVSGATITFSSNLASGDVINFIQILGDVLDLGVPSDATVTNAKTNFVSTSSAAGLQIKGDGTTDGTLQLNCSQNSHGIKLKSPPHSASASYTLTFPNNDGDANQVLTTNGSGVLSFADASGGMTLLTSGDITSTTSSFTINSTYVNDTYDHYQLWLRGKAAGDGVNMIMRYRNDADNGNVTSPYSWRVGGVADNGNGTNSTNGDLIRLTYAHSGNGANEGFNMVLNLMSPRSNLVPTACMWSLTNANTSDDFKAMHGAARRNDGTEKHSGFIIFFESGGDFANGTNYEFYGLKK